MRCTGGLGLPLSTVIRRLSLTALLACLAALALVVPVAFANDAPASDPPAASDSGAPPPSDEAPAEPPASDPAPIAVDPVPNPTPDPTPAPDPTPVADPVGVAVPPVSLPVDPPVSVPDPVATIDVPGVGDPGTGTTVTTGGDDSHPARGGGGPVSTGTFPSIAAPTVAGPAPGPAGPAVSAPAVTPLGGIIIPRPESRAPAAWRWPGAGSPSPHNAGSLLGSSFLNSAPPAVALPGTLNAVAATAASRHDGARHAPPIPRVAPAPWTPSAPGAPASAGASAPGGAAGGLGGWALAALFFVLLALAAPWRAIPRPALAPVLALRPAYAPARAPPVS
jgi:hypothetical protein